MRGPGHFRSILNLTMALFVLAGPTGAEDMHTYDVEPGATYRCSGSVPERDLYVWVGKIEEGPDGTTIASVALARAASVGEKPVGHAPFDIRQLSGCVREEPAEPIVDPATFEEGYQAWKTTAPDGGTGYFTLPPPEIYWMILGASKP
jgi:hypothetical protein